MEFRVAEVGIGNSRQFLSEASPDHFCSICTDLLTQPYLTDCGHHFCYTCRGLLLTRGVTECPECREQDVLTDARLNKHLQRQVNSLKVRCQHHEVGCQWVGELRYLQEHLDPAIRKCGFILLACPLGCGELVRGSAMKDHILNDCCKRSFECEHCGYCNKFDIVTEQHYPLCENFPMKCPNACSVFNLRRIDFTSHLGQCPLQVIQCPFTSAGCTVQLPRREMDEHEDKAVRQHLRMMMSMMQLTPNQEPPASTVVAATCTTKQLEYLVNLPPVEFTITDFMKKKECNAEWVSPAFYSLPQGYKFSLVVYPNGYGATNTHFSVAVLLLEADDAKPLEVGFIVDLLNWKEDKQNFQEVIEFNSANDLVTDRGVKRSPILTKFFSHSSLSYNSTTNTEYLQNDCVRLRVSKVILYSTALLNKTPSWQNPHNGYQSLHEFTLTDFSKRKQFNYSHNSSPFYTREHGYKFCLEVDVNGHRSIINEYVSVFVVLMAGEYDDQLEWPFVGKFDIELLNWRNDKNHRKKTLSIIARHGFMKVTEGMIGESRGLIKFVSHSILAYDYLQNTEYLQEDCLRFRVNVNTKTKLVF